MPHDFRPQHSRNLRHAALEARKSPIADIDFATGSGLPGPVASAPGGVAGSGRGHACQVEKFQTARARVRLQVGRRPRVRSQPAESPDPCCWRSVGVNELLAKSSAG